MSRDDLMFLLAILSFAGITLDIVLEILNDFVTSLGEVALYLDSIFFKGFSLLMVIYLGYYFFLYKPKTNQINN